MMTTDAIQLPDAPGIPGLRFRHFRAGQDFHHMATIIRTSAEADDTERSDTPEELEHFFAHLTNCDPYTDMIFAEVDPGDGRDPEVIGYSRGTWVRIFCVASGDVSDKFACVEVPWIYPRFSPLSKRP